MGGFIELTDLKDDPQASIRDRILGTTRDKYVDDRLKLGCNADNFISHIRHGLRPLGSGCLLGFDPFSFLLHKVRNP
jgi:hypothetical protein